MTKAIVWLRQDLRLADNPALWHAAEEHEQLLLVYIRDESLSFAMGGAQCWWLHHSLKSLHDSLRTNHQAQLVLRQGNPEAILQELVEQHQIDAIYWNRRYEPESIQQDKQIKSQFKQTGLKVESYNSALLNEPWTILNKSGQFFKVFTPYWRATQQAMSVRELYPIPSITTLASVESDVLEDWSLLPTQPNWAKDFEEAWAVGENGAQQRLEDFINSTLTGYDKDRDRPGTKGTSRLSPHLHFGEISPWQVWHGVQQVSSSAASFTKDKDRYLAELGWREFSYYLLYHFPQLPQQNFRSEFDDFSWVQDEEALAAWQQGMTGYPIVDAGMRELWHTGYMHNRVRMIAASFLTKDLLIHWDKGAEWFWDTLVDADLASNSASWQWVAGCGADAAPYFRIFNPVLQGEKFDPQGHYVRQWVPELAAMPNSYLHQPWNAPAEVLATAKVCLGQDYPKPIVDHKAARELALAHYQHIKKQPK